MVQVTWTLVSLFAQPTEIDMASRPKATTIKTTTNAKTTKTPQTTQTAKSTKSTKSTKAPKTTSRGRQEKREDQPEPEPERTPLTPSLTHALNALNIAESNGSNKHSSDTPNTSNYSPIKMATLNFGGGGGAGSNDIGDVSINPFLETSVPIGQSLKSQAIFGGNGLSSSGHGHGTSRPGSRTGSRPTSRTGSRPGSRAGSRPGSPSKRSKSAHGPKNTVNLYGMETKLDIIDISEWPLNKKEKEKNSTNATEDTTTGITDGRVRKRSKSQTGAVSVWIPSFALRVSDCSYPFFFTIINKHTH